MPVCIWHAMFCTYCWISRNGVCGVQRWRDAEEWRWLGYRADRAQTSGFLHSGQRILDGWVDSSITCWHLRWTVSHTRIHTIWWLVLAALCVFTLLWAIRVFRSPTCWWHLTWTAHFERNLNEMIKHGKEALRAVALALCDKMKWPFASVLQVDGACHCKRETCCLSKLFSIILEELTLFLPVKYGKHT